MLLSDLSATELVDLLVLRVDDAARLRLLAQQERKKHSQPARWAVAAKARAAVEEALTEVLQRLGADSDPRAISRAGLIAYARSKTSGSCAMCRVRPFKGRGLHWWTADGRPLAWMHANRGGTTEEVEFARKLSELLCAPCAAHRHKAKLTNKQEPNLKLYRGETND